jgi:hypothetical protein
MQFFTSVCVRTWGQQGDISGWQWQGKGARELDERLAGSTGVLSSKL